MHRPLNKTPHADERLDALLSITGRMDGYLYRCRNDHSHTMLYISDGISNISGYPPGDFIQNKVLEYVSVIHPDDLERVFAAVNTALETKRDWNVDYRIVPNFGRAVWVREIGGGVFNDAGELVFLEGFVIDISDRKLIEDSNAYLLTQLKDLNELLSAQKRELQLAKQKSDHSANHDVLTGLPNRRAFHNQLKLAHGREPAPRIPQSDYCSSISTGLKRSMTPLAMRAVTLSFSTSPVSCKHCFGARTLLHGLAETNSHFCCLEIRS